jgi:hypothetical protein
MKKSSKPRTLEDTFNDLLSNIQKPLGIHHFRTILSDFYVNLRVEVAAVSRNRYGVEQIVVTPFFPFFLV